MAERLPQLLRARHAALKTAWLRRLHACPPVSALARPEILAHYMDDSLRQLGGLLSGKVSRKLASGETFTTAIRRNCCACGLNPLLDYYVTGEETLGAVLGELTETERDLLNQCWHRLAHGEIEALCKVCCRRGVACAASTASVAQS